MTIIGNILLFIASLVYIGLVSTIWGKQPHSGDYAVGYAWTVLLLNALLIVLLSVTTVIITAKGGFLWVASTPASRFFIVTVILAATLFTTAMCSILKNEHGPVPAVIRNLSAFAPFIIPLVLIFASFVLLNGITINKALYLYPLVAALLISTIAITSALSNWIISSVKREERKLRAMKEDSDSNRERMLAEIDSCDVTKNTVFILVFTDSNQEQVVKEKAVAKIKTNPAWQQELVRLLKSGWAPEAFTFLASNDADSTELFTEPIKEGILQQAKLIRESIRGSSHPSHFYPELFSWQTDRVLGTVNRFNGTDYTPEVKALRAALDEPSEFKKINFSCTETLDNWLKKNQQ